MSDAEGLGPLPNTRLISAVFTRADAFDRAAAAALGYGMLESVAGLVVAHRELAAVRPAWDDLLWSWGPGDEPHGAPDPAADPFTRAYDEVQRHMLSIDLEARRLLGPPGAESTPHRESLGAVFGRMAHLYTISFDRFVLDGPGGANRRRLVGEYIAYEALARDLVAKRKHLPALADRPAS